MEFKVRFFVVALLLSVIVGVARYIPMLSLWLYQWVSPEEMFWFLMLVSAVLELALGVVVPFAVFYSMSRNVGSTSAYWAAFVSVFFGCWIGSASVEVSKVVISLLQDGEHLISTSWMVASTSWMVAVWIAWLVVSVAVSRIFFVSLSAVLFAYYRGTVNQPVGEASVKSL